MSAADRVPTEALARGILAVGLLAVALVHLLDLPGTLDETPLIGAGYLLLIAAVLGLAVMALTKPGRRVWLLAGAVAAGAFVAYVLSRTTGIPTDSDDVGNWNCALGTAAISVEGTLVALAAWRLAPQRRRVPVVERPAIAEPVSLNSRPH